MSGPQLYSAAQVEQIPWPNTPDGDYARRFLAPLLRIGTPSFIENIDTRLFVLVWDELVLPVTVNEAKYENCYTVAPYNHYIVYARFELRGLGDPLAAAALDALLAGLGGTLQAGQINKTVHVNNWMLSTNLYPPLTPEQLQAIRDLLLRRFPEHALVFRSVNTVDGPALLDGLQGLGFLAIASRQLYYFRPNDPTFSDKSVRKNILKDNRLLSGGPYEPVGHADVTEADLQRILDLYDFLYIEKYSRHNPRFTKRFITLAWRDHTLELRGLRHRETGQLDGAIGFFSRNGHMTTPLFGYDIHLPQALGLYRMLTLLAYGEARERDLLLNQSSGAGNFKRTRGGRPNIEYSLVYEQHLPWPRRLVWQGLSQAINQLAIPLMQHYKL